MCTYFCGISFTRIRIRLQRTGKYSSNNLELSSLSRASNYAPIISVDMEHVVYSFKNILRFYRRYSTLKLLIKPVQLFIVTRMGNYFVFFIFHVFSTLAITTDNDNNRNTTYMYNFFYIVIYELSLLEIHHTKVSNKKNMDIFFVLIHAYVDI